MFLRVFVFLAIKAFRIIGALKYLNKALISLDDINIQSYERQALYDLYNATNGKFWDYKAGDNGHWDFSDPEVNPCLPSNPWQGLNCTLTTISSTSSYYIIEIQLSHYNLNGFIPCSISNFTQLQSLSLSYNKIKQIIPNTIGNLSELKQLFLNENQLTGTIPDSIGELLSLRTLFLSYNKLNGTIPSRLTNLINLHYLTIDFNKLSKTIPYSIRKLSSLRTLTVSNNYLSGTIQSSISTLTNLKQLSLGSNSYITGTIPDWICNLTNLKYLDLNDSKLIGKIPSNLSNLKDIVGLYLSLNNLTGTIPEVVVEKLTELQYLSLNDNDLTGTLPASISKLASLKQIYLQNNQFTGNLDKVFDGNYQNRLRKIRLSYNQFTGRLPYDAFLSGTLSVFTAVSNCFHGSIPSIICHNKRLNALSLDGLECASSCQNKIIPGISRAYISNNDITGGIPQCLWSMPNLTVLHLSGNALTGSLPDDIELSDSLVDISLSYNVLTGSIPGNFQKKMWNNLDLSNNRISGRLLSSYASQAYNASLKLNNNRLSGYSPNNLKHMKDINILKGNYYDCKNDRSDLPTHDKNKDTYQCGSDSFYILYYVWLGLLVIMILTVLLMWLNRNYFHKYFPNILSIDYNIWKWLHLIEFLETHYGKDDTCFIKIENMNHFKQYNAIFETIMRLSIYYTVFIIIILLPIYFILTFYYSDHAENYVWLASAIFISGKTAFGVAFSILVIFMVTMILLFWVGSSIKKRSRDMPTLRDINNNNDTDTISTASVIESINTVVDRKNSRLKVYLMYTIYVAINLIVISGVNIAYVYAVLYQSYLIATFVTILVAIFKVVWNNIISTLILRWVVKYLSLISISNKAFQRTLFIMQLVVSLLNNILMPCFIIAIISPNCFYYLFVPETDVKTTTKSLERTCFFIDTNEVDCKAYNREFSTSYSPPFTYSYECSADFITNYTPVFVFTCIISTFISPFVSLATIKLSLKYTWIPKYLPLRKLYLPLDSEIKPPLIYRDQIYTFLVTQLTLVGSLLTFGAIFPPLAVTILITICTRLFFNKAAISTFILNAFESKAYPCLDMIEEDCKVIPSLATIRRCGFMILSTCAIFYTLFLFDMLGDEVGLANAYWILIVMPLLPILAYVLFRLYINWLIYKKGKHTIDTSANKKHNNNVDDRYTMNNLEFKDMYKSDIELRAGISLNPLLVPTTNIIVEEDGRGSIIRDINVVDRNALSMRTSDSFNISTDDINLSNLTSQSISSHLSLNNNDVKRLNVNIDK